MYPDLARFRAFPYQILHSSIVSLLRLLAQMVIFALDDWRPLDIRHTPNTMPSSQD
jgi:hypothetical protein